ncbi:hypothetical protein, partial [Flavobacterium alvei]|uniref:hypothetical protein n=1 Tax=Flavobacterium alvei TaxID=2080416 RepID=UPI0026F1A43E
EEPVNVFDPWQGADFKLRMRKVDGYPNYDQSMFLEPAPIGSDEEILEVVNRQYTLAEFVDPKNFKSYEELSRKLASVLDGSGSTQPSAASLAADDDDYTPPVRQEVVKPAPVKISQAADEDDDDDVLIICLINLIKLIEDSGYMLYADTHINSIFVRKNNWIR